MSVPTPSNAAEPLVQCGGEPLKPKCVEIGDSGFYGAVIPEGVTQVSLELGSGRLHPKVVGAGPSSPGALW